MGNVLCIHGRITSSVAETMILLEYASLNCSWVRSFAARNLLFHKYASKMQFERVRCNSPWCLSVSGSGSKALALRSIVSPVLDMHQQPRGVFQLEQERSETDIPTCIQGDERELVG